MQPKKTLTALVLLIIILSIVATTTGIYSNSGAGSYPYTSIRGKSVAIYGKGLYRHMSAEVAPQGIAQDYITLFIGIPLLLFSFVLSLKGSLKARFMLAGSLAYFLITYLFYTVMAMYNEMFLGYIFLTGASFYSFMIVISSFNIKQLRHQFTAAIPVKIAGGFLIFISLAIALMWLSIVVPPLFDGSIIPVQAEHYTTLIVQGLDLAILLPSAIVVAVLFIRKKPLGYLLCPVYFIFLSLLMTALSAKIVAMAILGFNVIPAIFIIPAFNIFSIICSAVIMRSIKVR